VRDSVVRGREGGSELLKGAKGRTMGDNKIRKEERISRLSPLQPNAKQSKTTALTAKGGEKTPIGD